MDLKKEDKHKKNISFPFNKKMLTFFARCSIIAELPLNMPGDPILVCDW